MESTSLEMNPAWPLPATDRDTRVSLDVIASETEDSCQVNSVSRRPGRIVDLLEIKILSKGAKADLFLWKGRLTFIGKIKSKSFQKMFLFTGALI